MFMVTYSESTSANGSGTWKNKSKTFNNETDAKTFIKNVSTKDDFKHLQMWSPVGSENIDYKEKFEELYDFVLKGAGVRKVELPVKKMI